ncbi:hypothetical protein OROGR_015016 [Orobanche gracilis]
MGVGYYRGKQRDKIGDTSKGVSVVLISRNEKRGLEAIEKLKVNNAGVNGVRDSEEAIKKLQSQSESSLLSSVMSGRTEKILEVDGTVTTQPVLEHVVSNLSFNISSTDVIKLLLPMGDILSEVVLLLQEESALRLVDPSLRTSEYRPINIFINFYSAGSDMLCTKEYAI